MKTRAATPGAAFLFLAFSPQPSLSFLPSRPFVPRRSALVVPRSEPAESPAESGQEHLQAVIDEVTKAAEKSEGDALSEPPEVEEEVEDGEEEFSSLVKHQQFLDTQGDLPQGFRIGKSKLTFDPVEEPTRVDLPMSLTLILLDEPTDAWTALFTTNAFPGAPVKVGRKRLAEGGPLQAIVVNNKISNVCPGGEPGSGEQSSEDICTGLGALLAIREGERGLEGAANRARMVLPCSTGIIGWSLPVPNMLRALPQCVESAVSDDLNAVDAARSIMTTDRYPKCRGETVRIRPPSDDFDPDDSGEKFRIVGIAKGAGMIEPHLATMLVYLFTDLDLPRATLDKSLRLAVKKSFNCISVDSDESTSDTVVLISSQKVPCPPGSPLVAKFDEALLKVCEGLADDVVRNGEGTNHVMEVSIKGSPKDELAVGLGRAIVNSPLLKCAVAGNDPNVGRLVAAVGKYVGDNHAAHSKGQAQAAKGQSILGGCVMKMGGKIIFANGQFILNGVLEQELIQHMKAAELGDHGKAEFPLHKRRVSIEVDLGIGLSEAVILGSDLTHEYVTVNADYRS